MPHWIVLLAAALCAWLVVAVLGGMIVGRALGVIHRRRHRSI
jgi:hypothetical protein